MDIKKMGNVTCGILNNPKCLINARALLYESYIKDLAWEITHDNPSNIKVNHTDSRTLLTDDYDELSVWFSTSNKEEVIACARLCREDENGLLEIERYENARRSIKPILDQKEKLNIIELNREAILSSYSEHRELYGLILLKEVFEYCLDKNHTVLTTSNIPDWIAIYKLIAFEEIKEYTFKYFDSEPAPVQVYMATSNDLKKLLRNIDNRLNAHRYQAINNQNLPLHNIQDQWYV